MKRNIKAHSDGVTIEISEIQGTTEQLLDAFRKCQDGRCTCPTDEYSKLQSLEIGQTEDKISLRLMAKDGRTFDRNEIEECLDHTYAQETSSD